VDSGVVKEKCCGQFAMLARDHRDRRNGIRELSYRPLLSQVVKQLPYSRIHVGDTSL